MQVSGLRQTSGVAPEAGMTESPIISVVRLLLAGEVYSSDC